MDRLPSLTLRRTVGQQFSRALLGFRKRAPVLVMGHHDADGLSALALFKRALEAAGRVVTTRVVGRGENAWSPEIAGELAALELAGIVLTDLGARAASIKSGTPLVVVDHHVPAGVSAPASKR